MTFQDLMGINYIGDVESIKRLYAKNQQYFREILTQLERNNLVPLFGAGFSGDAYPGWNPLLCQIAKAFPNCVQELETFLVDGKFEEASSLLCDEMGENDFLDELHSIFGRHTLPDALARISDERKAIPQIFTGPLMTTNVEQVIEELYSRKLPVLCPHTDYHQPQADRALQSSEPILFKLHGDIEDREHVVFTKQAYDIVYGDRTTDKTLVQTLAHIFSSHTVLFLGCSLESDRILKLLESYCCNHTYYALVELPPETKNESNPFEPRLTDQDGREIEAYRRRRQFMSEHNIRCIWYPSGQFSALDAFLRELRSLGVSPQVSPSAIPAARRAIIGREKIINEIYQYCMKGSCPVFVTGAGGIGKTEACHVVLRHMEQANKRILYTDVTNIHEPTLLCHAMAQAAGADALTGTEAANLTVYLGYVKKRIAACSQAVLYLDNWEDLWYAIKERDDQRLQLLEWLADLCQTGVPILLSSRISPQEYDITVKIFPLPALDRAAGEDRALFQAVYQAKNGHLSLTGAGFEALLRQLDGHPLAIVLTATQAAGAANWDNVLARWTQATQKTSNPRHSRLDTALRISWDGISGCSSCTLIWGLLALSWNALAFSQLMKLTKSEAERQQWEEGVRLLRNTSLLDWSEDGESLQMLQPVKEAFFLLTDEEEALTCYGRWYALFVPVLQRANDRISPDRQIAHVQVIEQLPQILYLLERMVSSPWQDRLVNSIIVLTRNMQNYFSFSAIQSLTICGKLANFDHIKDHKDHKKFFAQIAECQGDLFSLLGNPDKAEELYVQAEELFRQERDNLGLAYTLQSQGELFSLLGNPDKAEELYVQAEELFRQECDNFGLANTLQSRGELFSLLGNPDKAEELYVQAEELFRQERHNLGLAYTLQSRGELFRLLGNPDKAEELYVQAEELFRQERSNLGLANTLKSRGELFRLLGNPDKAEELYVQAEELFRQERHSLGLANTLKSRGELFRLLGNPDKAEELYVQAEELFRQERHNLGLAYTLKSRGDLLRLLGNPDKAEELYVQAEELFRQERHNLGLANTLQSRGELFRLLGNPDKAEELYVQAEELFRQERSNLGLANTLQSRGDLLRLLGNLDKAEELYVQAEELFRQERHNLGLANTLQSRGDLFRLLGNPDKAEELYVQTEELFRQERHNLGLANTLQSRGILQVSNGNMDGAIDSFQYALTLYEAEQEPYGCAITCALLSILLENSEVHCDEARTLKQRAQETAERLASAMKKTVLTLLSDSESV